MGRGQRGAQITATSGGLRSSTTGISIENVDNGGGERFYHHSSDDKGIKLTRCGGPALQISQVLSDNKNDIDGGGLLIPEEYLKEFREALILVLQERPPKLETRPKESEFSYDHIIFEMKDDQQICIRGDGIYTLNRVEQRILSAVAPISVWRQIAEDIRTYRSYNNFDNCPVGSI
jgi:hypothetical protein